MEWIGSILSTVINAGWKIYLAAFIASAALLFFPNSLVTQLGLEEIRHSYRTYAGIVLVASASLLMVNIISSIVHLALKPWRDGQFNRSIHKMLRELTQDEKDFLRPFIFGNANTVTGAPRRDHRRTRRNILA
ncbi:superinfection exclusion B family protein [Bradyrhizobium arachidis]|uniref:superinfection exclusion B family protein n=1 Tax=Bradyrhizobium arachidis TaxID=858423 RepID=UPI0021623AFA|nr:superinfection exclusion B family protein [Bradyrhizobium arachidis]UVO35733.1 superinfection exclusion B family protein [Bradyrhizobium arachidis]